MIFRHYMRRALLEPLSILILTFLPVLLIVVLSMVYNEVMIDYPIFVNGYNMITSQLTVVMLIMFQLFGGSIMVDWLYSDFKSAKRWRLLSAPCRLNTYILSAGMASWVFSLIQGLLIILTAVVFLDAYLGHAGILAAVLLTTSAMGLFLHMFLFLLLKTKSAVEMISQAIIQGMMFVSVWMANLEMSASPLRQFFFDVGTPVALARRAVEYSGFIGNDMNVALQALGILLAITLLLGGGVLFLGRRRSF